LIDRSSESRTPTLALAALGIVYGDIQDQAYEQRPERFVCGRLKPPALAPTIE